MAEYVWSVLCRRGLLDAHTNQLSLIDVIEDIEYAPTESDRRKMKAKATLGLPLAATMVSMWRRSDSAIPEKIELRVIIQLPDGEKITSPIIMQGDLVKGKALRLIMRLPKFPYRGPGLYRIIVEQKPTGENEWARGGSVPVEIQETVGQVEKSEKPSMATTKKRGRH